MPGLVCPPAPRMRTVDLPNVTSPALSMISFGQAHYSRASPQEVRSPWLSGSVSILRPLEYYAFSSVPNTQHHPNQYNWFINTPVIEGSVENSVETSIESNALGLSFDQFTGHPPMAPLLTPPLTPRHVVYHTHLPETPVPETPVFQEQDHQEDSQEGLRSFLAELFSDTGDAQASPQERVSQSDISDCTTVGAHQETGPVSGTNTVANRSLSPRSQRKKESRRESRKLLRPYGRHLFTSGTSSTRKCRANKSFMETSTSSGRSTNRRKRTVG